MSQSQDNVTPPQEPLKKEQEDTSPPEDTPNEKTKKERDEYLEGWKRTKADFANYKKEEHERMRMMAQYGNSILIGELLSVIDSIDVGLTILKDEDAAKKGMLLIRSQFEDILKKHGLTAILLEPGTPFDPARAEAMMEVESTFPQGSVVEELSKGYMLHDKVLRPARVTIAKGHTS